MLDRVVGPGNATVAVAADMDQRVRRSVEETFTTPDRRPAAERVHQTDRVYTGTGGRAAGVLGPDNIAVPGGAGGDGNLQLRPRTTKNNAVEQGHRRHRAIPAGAIKRQTVSVAVDADAAGGLDLATLDGPGHHRGRHRRRPAGTSVTVELVPFNTAGAPTPPSRAGRREGRRAKPQRQAELIRTAIITAGIVLLVLLALLVYARWTRRQNREPVDLGELQDFQLEIEAPQALQLKPGSRNRSRSAAPSTTALELTGLPELSDEQKDMNRKRAEIDALAAAGTGQDRRLPAVLDG